MPQDVFPTEAPHVELVKNRALECENMDLSGKSGGTTEYNVDDQIDDSLRSIQKIRDEILLKESILQERSAQCDMDMQTLLSEGKMTPKAVSIISKYKETCSDMTEVTNSSCSGDGGQPITKRKKLREALLRHCQVRNLKLNLCITILNATCTLDTCQCRSLMRFAVGPIGYPQDTRYYLQHQMGCTTPVYV
uniref:Uncharacterized protein n=1 Tax=Aegilops tauschii subsp. strangulata TaxID=200361 RepID=A0A453LB41_AEGTS